MCVNKKVHRWFAKVFGHSCCFWTKLKQNIFSLLKSSLGDLLFYTLFLSYKTVILSLFELATFKLLFFTSIFLFIDHIFSESAQSLLHFDVTGYLCAASLLYIKCVTKFVHHFT